MRRRDRAGRCRDSARRRARRHGFTDPPYNVNYANSAKDKLRGKNRPILNDALGEEFGALLYDASVNMLTVTKGAIYICMSSSELDTLQKAFREAGGKWSTFVIWAKNTFTLGRSDYQRQYEPILYGWKDGADHYWCGARDQGDVWFFDKPHEERSAPDDEAGGAGRARHPQLVEEPRHRARSVRRLGHHDDRGRARRPAGAAGRTRSEVRRCDRAALAGADGTERQAGSHGEKFRGNGFKAKGSGIKMVRGRYAPGTTLSPDNFGGLRGLPG